MPVAKIPRIEIDTLWVERWQPELIGTLLFVLRVHQGRGQVLLIHKKTGHGQGRVNGPGGKLDAGESLTACARREVFEEVGLEIHNIRYVGSQAWPYPGQLMLGYIADAKTEDIKIDGVEIAEAHWFKYDQLPSVVAPPTIMAGRLIQLFVEESKARYG